MQDTTKHQWQLVEKWMCGGLHGKPWPYVTIDEASELVPVSHKVSVLLRSEGTISSAVLVEAASYMQLRSSHMSSYSTGNSSLQVNMFCPQYDFPGMHIDLDKTIQAAVSQDLSLVPGTPSYVLKYVGGCTAWAQCMSAAP
jgi:hypothetical protein